MTAATAADVTHLGGYVYHRGKRVGRITTMASEDPCARKFLVHCFAHGCGYEVAADGAVTRDALLGWLQLESVTMEEHKKAFANILQMQPPPPPPPPDQPAEGLDGPDGGQHPGGTGRAPDEPRQARKHMFGPWSISKVVSAGQFVAWGANCNHHSNAHQPGLRCKRQVTFRGGRVSADEARVRCKAWLLAGVGVDRDSVTGKDDHFNICPYSLPLQEESHLDQLAWELI